MSRSKSRFTQADVTKLIKAARGTGFECVTIEVLPGTGGLRATYSNEAGQQSRPPASAGWEVRRANEQVAARSFSEAAGKPAPAEVAPVMSDEEWAIALRASALSGREQNALEQLFRRRGLDVPFNEIKGAGLVTQMNLETRGYATIKMDGDRLISWRLTDEGEQFYRAMKSLPPHL